MLSKKQLVDKPTRIKKLYFKHPKNGAKFVSIRSGIADVSDAIYAFDEKGVYRGSANKFSKAGEKKMIEISESEFLEG